MTPKIMNSQALERLFEKTNFCKDKKLPEWDDIKIEDDYVYIPQCSYFGGTLINMGDTYENGGFDGLFIQELIKRFKFLYERNKVKR